MTDLAMKLDDHFTFSDYRQWPDDERWELIEGGAWMMSSPSRSHQEIEARLFTDLRVLLKNRPCGALAAPFDVLLPRRDEVDDEVDSVVQPDIVVFCEKAKLRPTNARGAPDLVMEILSPSTARKDQNEKFRLYERSGVREYWVIDPFAQSIWLYRQVEGVLGRFDRGVLRERYADWGPIRSSVIEGFEVVPEELFADLE